jgi:hypothetical protein
MAQRICPNPSCDQNGKSFPIFYGDLEGIGAYNYMMCCGFNLDMKSNDVAAKKQELAKKQPKTHRCLKCKRACVLVYYDIGLGGDEVSKCCKAGAKLRKLKKLK